MQDRRLFLRVILKALALTGVLFLLYILSGSLFTAKKMSSNTVGKLPLVYLDISTLQKGRLKKIHWNGKEVAILYRRNPVIDKPKQLVSPDDSIHESLQPWMRSQKPEYFVYINAGDSGNCPLFYSQGTFKDICSANQFDENGRGKEQQHLSLKIPPHYFKENGIVFGAWSEL